MNEKELVNKKKIVEDDHFKGIIHPIKPLDNNIPHNIIRRKSSLITSETYVIDFANFPLIIITNNIYS